MAHNFTEPRVAPSGAPARQDEGVAADVPPVVDEGLCTICGVAFKGKRGLGVHTRTKHANAFHMDHHQFQVSL